MTFTAIRPDFGLSKGREVSLCSVAQASALISAFKVTFRELVGAPAGTPPAMITTLHDHALKALQTAVVIERLSAHGYLIVGNTPAEFRQLIATETARWKSVAKSAGINPMEAGR